MRGKNHIHVHQRFLDACFRSTTAIWKLRVQSAAPACKTCGCDPTVIYMCLLLTDCFSTLQQATLSIDFTSPAGYVFVSRFSPSTIFPAEAANLTRLDVLYKTCVTSMLRAFQPFAQPYAPCSSGTTRPGQPLLYPQVSPRMHSLTAHNELRDVEGSAMPILTKSNPRLAQCIWKFLILFASFWSWLSPQNGSPD
jgi:hypothetical protein